LLASNVLVFPALALDNTTRIVKDVSAEGACAISNMSAKQAILIALQSARAAAIEQAAGIGIVATTLVKNDDLVVDLIKTYSRGFIIREKTEWSLGKYQDDASKPPIPEYKVKLLADVAIPQKKGKSLGLGARLNNRVFRVGEKATIEITTRKESSVAVFNITADDRIVMLLPQPMEPQNMVKPGKPFLFPRSDSRFDLVMNTLPGHERDAEAFFVVAVDPRENLDFSNFFPPNEPLAFSAFFSRYVELAPKSEEVILPYEVTNN
jgi:hypothetical protein